MRVRGGVEKTPVNIFIIVGLVPLLKKSCIVFYKNLSRIIPFFKTQNWSLVLTGLKIVVK